MKSALKENNRVARTDLRPSGGPGGWAAGRKGPPGGGESGSDALPEIPPHEAGGRRARAGEPRGGRRGPEAQSLLGAGADAGGAPARSPRVTNTPTWTGRRRAGAVPTTVIPLRHYH